MERREVLMMRKKNKRRKKKKMMMMRMKRKKNKRKKKKKKKVYLTLNLPERRLLIRGLLSFRNKVIARGIDTVDIDRLLKKII